MTDNSHYVIFHRESGEEEIIENLTREVAHYLFYYGDDYGNRPFNPDKIVAAEWGENYHERVA